MEVGPQRLQDRWMGCGCLSLFVFFVFWVQRSFAHRVWICLDESFENPLKLIFIEFLFFFLQFSLIDMALPQPFFYTPSLFFRQSAA